MANRPTENEGFWPSNFVDRKHRLSPNSVVTLFDDTSRLLVTLVGSVILLWLINQLSDQIHTLTCCMTGKEANPIQYWIIQCTIGLPVRPVAGSVPLPVQLRVEATYRKRLIQCNYWLDDLNPKSNCFMDVETTLLNWSYRCMIAALKA